MLSIIIPVTSEPSKLNACLDSLLASDATACPVEIVVCITEIAAEEALSFEERVVARGWSLTVLPLSSIDRIDAMNAGDAAARWPWRAYINDTVTVAPELADKLCRALDGPKARFVYVRARVNAPSLVSRAYAATSQKVSAMLPIMQGCEFYAVNAAGRVRWGQFPDVITDDIYVKLLFNSEECIDLSSVNDGLAVQDVQALIRLRSRQGFGMKQIQKAYPDLLRQNENKASLGIKDLFVLGVRNPFGFLIYFGLEILARLDGSKRSG